MNRFGAMLTMMALLATASTEAQTLRPSEQASPLSSPQPGPARPSGPLQQKIAPGLAALTDDVLFDDLWRRPDLTLRDRSLVTIAALAAMGDDEQLGFCLRRGIESGLTGVQITEAVTHLGFYAGWGKATRAMTAVARTLGR
jgi:4-carboxymuconolactone decarboxylase